MSSIHILTGTGHALVLAATTTTAKATTSSALSYLPLILLIGLGGYLLFIRPRNQAMRRQQQQSSQIAVGDRVLTRAGIVGHVRGFSGERVQLEIADGVVIEVVRQGVGQKLPDELDDEDLIPPPPGAEDLDEDADSEHEAEEWGHEETAGDWHAEDEPPAEAAARHEDPFDVSAEDPLAGSPANGTADSGRRKGRKGSR